MPPEMWTEEYQIEFLRRHLDIAAARPFMAGMHVWAVADFKTGQNVSCAAATNFIDTYGGSRRPPSLSALPAACVFSPAVGSRQPRHNATSRIAKHTAAPATADAAGGAFRTWPTATTIAPA